MNIIITGASRGIGYETVLALAHYPEWHILALARSENKLNALQKEAQKIGKNNQVFIKKIDLTKDTHTDLHEILLEFGHVDVLINNAGLLINKNFDQLTVDDWQRSFEVNFLAHVRLIKYLLPWLGGSQHSHIVNISSMGAVQGSAKFKGLSAYSSSKAALANLAEVLAEEFKDKNVTVNCLALGAVQTEMLDEAFPGYKAPLSAKEMAAFILDFALTGHKFMNGKIIPVALSTP